MFTGEAVVRNNNSVNLDGKKFETISNVTPQHNVIAPMSYSSLGVVKILDNVNVHLFKLANGQRVAIIPKEGTTKVCSYVNTGSMNEPDNVRGISHFIEHNLFNGSKGYGAGEIFKNVGKMGASSNASTGFSKTDYYISSNLIEEDDLENSIKMHASMLDSPRFAENMIEKEKGPVISEINMITDDSVNLAMNKTLKNLYGIKSTSSDLIGGNAENIKNLTREKLVDYYSKNYAPQNIVTVVSGEVEPEKTMKLLSKYFTRTASPVISQYSQEFNPIQKTIREDIFSDKTNSTMIIMGLNGANNIDMKESAELMIINNLLSEGRGSRINGKLIPLNATCEISTERMGTQKNSPNAILLCAKSTDDNAEKVLKKIYSGIDDLKNNTPTQEEIDNIKKSIKISQEEISENSNIINSVVGNVMMDGDLDELNKYQKIRDNLNVDDIKSALNKYYDLNKVALTVVHPNLKDKTVVQKNHANAINFTGKTVKKDLAKLDKANKYALANGATAITYKKNSQNASFSYSIKCPHSYGEKYMTSLILSSMLKNGSSYRDEKSFYSDLEKNNISLFTKVDDDEISFNAFGADS